MSLKDQALSSLAVLALGAVGGTTVTNTVTNGQQDVRIEQLTQGDREIVEELRLLRQETGKTATAVAVLIAKEEAKNERPDE